MVGQARRGGLGRRAPPLANTHTEVEVEQQEGSDSSSESNLSQLFDIHHIWSNFQLSAFHVWEKYTYLSSTHITLSSWLLTPGPQNPQFQLYHQSSPQGTDYKITMVTEVKHCMGELVAEHPQLSHPAPQLLILISDQPSFLCDTSSLFGSFTTYKTI